MLEMLMQEDSIRKMNLGFVKGRDSVERLAREILERKNQ